VAFKKYFLQWVVGKEYVENGRGEKRFVLLFLKKDFFRIVGFWALYLTFSALVFAKGAETGIAPWSRSKKIVVIGTYNGFGSEFVCGQHILGNVDEARKKMDSVPVKWTEDSVPKLQEMDEVVVSGGLKEVTRMKSPIPVERYNASFFRKNPSPHLFEALSILNGVQPQINCNVCNAGDIHINGMEGPYTMVLIDGMPIVSSLSTVYGLMGIPAALIHRVEIVKGPSSTLYGSEAVAGIINVITQPAQGKPFFSADFTAGSYGDLNLDLGGIVSFSRKFDREQNAYGANGYAQGDVAQQRGSKIKKNSWQLLWGVNAHRMNNRVDLNGDFFTDVALQQRISAFQKWQLQRSNGLPFSTAIRYFNEHRWGGEMNWNRSFRGGTEVYGESIYTQRVEMFGQYGITKWKSNNPTTNWSPLLLEYSYNFHHQDAAYGATPYIAKQHTGFAQLRTGLSWRNHQVMMGIPFRYQVYDDNTPATTNAEGNNPDALALAGGFIQDEWNWNERWTLLSGLRMEWNNKHGWIPAPRLALRFQPNAQQTFRLSGGNGFRVVNLFTEDHQALSGARTVVLQESLNPERSWNLNLNYAHQFPLGKKGFMQWDVSGFYTYFSNKIIADYDTDPNLILYKNLDGFAVSRGVSIQTDINWANKWKIMLGSTLMDVFSRELNEEQKMETVDILFAPDFTINYAVSYTTSHQKWTIDVTGKTFGPMRLPTVPNDFRPERSPVFSQLNLQFTYRANKRLECFAGVKNLLNFLPENPILHPDDPFDRLGGKYFDELGNPRPDTNPNGYTFDPSYNYAPMQGIRAFAGIRYFTR
jgi:outer membrane receptor for ferrienterochelin and colicins